MTVKERPIQPTGTEIGTTLGHLFDLGAYLRGAAQTADREAQEQMDGLLRSTPAGVHVATGFDSAPVAYEAWKEGMRVYDYETFGGAVAAMVAFDITEFPGTPDFEPVQGGDNAVVSLDSMVLRELGQRVGMVCLRAQDSAAANGLTDPGQGIAMNTGLIGEFRAQHATEQLVMQAIDFVLAGFQSVRFSPEFGLPA